MKRAAIAKNKLWDWIRQSFIEPKVDDERLSAGLKEAMSRQPTPVLWLLGKTQSGKTSIIRALTGAERAEIGNGFKPCTRTASFYDFPPEIPVVRFLDSRGLGEVDYDPAEDLHFCESQAHLVVAVMKVSDVRQDAVREVLHSVRRRHPHWPILIVQTCLHEAYPTDFEHPLPYPFADDGWEPAVPSDLRRQIRNQRDRLGKLPGDGPVLWVPVDLTQPGDGYLPVDYGLEALWAAIEAGSSLGLWDLLRADPGVKDVYSRAAHPHIMGYVVAAAGIGALPLVDLALVPALQLKLLHTLASLYKFSWTRRASSEFFGLLGTGFLAGYGLRWAGRGAAKLIPGWGQTVGALWSSTTSATVTFALGKAACHYLAQKSCRNGVSGNDQVDPKILREVYAQALARGRSLSFLGKQRDRS